MAPVAVKMVSYEYLFQLLTAAVSLCLLITPSQSSLPTEEIDALLAFKDGIQDDPYGVLAFWNTTHSDPCGWSGLSCSSAADHVVNLRLYNSSLNGFLSPKIGALSYLEELTLGSNRLSGTLPRGLGMLRNLLKLDLSDNQLSGPIPTEFGGMVNLSQLYLSHNNLTGALPAELGNLEHLQELRVDRNCLDGQLVGSNSSYSSETNRSTMPDGYGNNTGLCLLRQLRVGNFSFNFFTGKVPPCLLSITSSSFEGNCFQDRNASSARTSEQCDDFRSKTNGEGSNSTKFIPKNKVPHRKLQQPLWLLILEIFTGAMLAIFVATVLTSTVRRCQKSSPTVIPWKKSTSSKDHMSISTDAELLKHVLIISRQELEVACEDFSNIIGSFSDTVIYKGTLSNKCEIAVISLCTSENNWTSHLELCFHHEVTNLARINHENTAKLHGYCKEKDPFSRMLVFEYASNGTLYEHLNYSEESQLSWRRRMKIIIDIASGLRYLLTELQPPISLSGLHSSSVYLNDEFSPKLVDFESWKTLTSNPEKYSGRANSNGYHVYQESMEKRYMDIQANTYAFGIILLEIVSGRPPLCKDRGHLVEWAMEHLEMPDKLCNLVDPKLRYFNHDDLRIICNVAGLCLQSEASKRPSMAIIAAMLENGIDTSTSATLKESHLSWAELALLS